MINLEPMNVSLFGSRVFADVNQVKMWSSWIRVGPESILTGVLIRRVKFGHIYTRMMAM